MNPAPRVTLQTIADLVGVSRATVSNAYNRPDRLSAELRERILTTARELGYPGPDPAARRLRLGHAGAIGLLFTEPLSYAFVDPTAVLFLGSLAWACETADTGLLLLPSPPGADVTPALRNAVVDAMCVYSMPERHPAVDAVLGRRLPTVFVDEPRVEGAAFVGVDDRRGGRLAGEHVAAVGHRCVAALTPRLLWDGYSGPVDDERLRAATYRVFRDRLEGLREALAAAGIRWEDVPVQERDNTPEAGAAGAHALLDLDPRPTALVAVTDQLALGALRAARERGLAVPDDLTVTGFDDLPAAGQSGLTTVAQPLADKGLVAGRMLLSLVRGEAVADEILGVRLTVRGSSGPPPG